MADQLTITVDDVVVTVEKFEPGADPQGRETRALVVVEINDALEFGYDELKTAMVSMVEEGGKVNSKKVTGVVREYHFTNFIF